MYALFVCFFFSPHCNTRVFDVRSAQEQGIVRTPQTGNEKFKQIGPCLWDPEKKREICREECREIEPSSRWRMWNRRNESRGSSVQSGKVVIVWIFLHEERRGIAQECDWTSSIDSDHTRCCFMTLAIIDLSRMTKITYSSLSLFRPWPRLRNTQQWLKHCLFAHYTWR